MVIIFILLLIQTVLIQFVFKPVFRIHPNQRILILISDPGPHPGRQFNTIPAGSRSYCAIESIVR
jgi:hypothetical protein